MANKPFPTVRMAHNNVTPIEFSPSGKDAFGRLRTSEPYSLFEYRVTNDQHRELFWSDRITNSGSITILTSSAETKLTISGTEGDLIETQTKVFHHYQPGKSLLTFQTFNFSGSDNNVRKRIGYFDENNGYFLELSGSELYVVERSDVGTNGSAVVETRVSQSDWNQDTFDGQGPSKINLDVNKVQLLSFDMEWLGVGRARCALLHEGDLVYFHHFDHANKNTDVYIKSANLPARCEIEAMSGSSVSSFRQICTSVISEGGFRPQSIHRSADRGLTSTAIGGNLEPLVSIRVTEGGLQNAVNLHHISILNAGNSSYRWDVRLNPTVTGGTAASWQTSSGSIVECDIARNGVTSGGYMLASGYETGRSQIDIDLNDLTRVLGSDLDGTRDEVVLSAQIIGGGSDDFYAGISFEELI